MPKNYCNWTLIVKVIAENVVTCFFFGGGNNVVMLYSLLLGGQLYIHCSRPWQWLKLWQQHMNDSVSPY